MAGESLPQHSTSLLSRLERHPEWMLGGRGIVRNDRADTLRRPILMPTSDTLRFLTVAI